MNKFKLVQICSNIFLSAMGLMFEVSRLRDSMEPESSLWIALDSGSSEGSKMFCHKSVGLDLTLMNSRKKWPWLPVSAESTVRILRSDCT